MLVARLKDSSIVAFLQAEDMTSLAMLDSVRGDYFDMLGKTTASAELCLDFNESRRRIDVDLDQEGKASLRVNYYMYSKMDGQALTDHNPPYSVALVNLDNMPKEYAAIFEELIQVRVSTPRDKSD